MTLRVGFSDTLLVDPTTRDALDGIGVYTRQMRSRLAANPGVRLVPVVMGRRATGAAPPGTFAFKDRMTVAMACSIVSGASFRGAGALSQQIDVYFATDYRVPRLRNTPVCATVYDAIPLSHPQWANQRLITARNWVLRNCVQWADRVLAISQAMVPEIVRHYGIAENRITVIPLGVDASWFVVESPARLREVCARHAIAPGYFLAVGTLQPRKNIDRLVEAYMRLPASTRAEHQLVVVGKEGWSATQTVALLRSCKEEGVHWLDRVPDADLHAIYQAAAVFAFPSLYEGFGLPVLEAFASRTPVITSTVTSLPEVAGNAACLVDPYDVDAISAALQRMVDDRAWADDLRAKGYERAKGYTWQACADRTAEVLRQMA